MTPCSGVHNLTESHFRSNHPRTVNVRQNTVEWTTHRMSLSGLTWLRQRSRHLTPKKKFMDRTDWVFQQDFDFILYALVRNIWHSMPFSTDNNTEISKWTHQFLPSTQSHLSTRSVLDWFPLSTLNRRRLVDTWYPGGKEDVPWGLFLGSFSMITEQQVSTSLTSLSILLFVTGG